MQRCLRAKEVIHMRSNDYILKRISENLMKMKKLVALLLAAIICLSLISTYIRTKSSAKHQNSACFLWIFGFSDCRERQSMGFKRPLVRIQSLGPKMVEIKRFPLFLWQIENPNHRIRMGSAARICAFCSGGERFLRVGARIVLRLLLF